MKYKNERGAVILESTYCILLAIFVLFFFLSFGFFLYQKTAVGIIANEVAEEAIVTYKLRNVADSESVSSTDVAGIGKYRYLLFGGKFERKSESKAKTLADTRLTQTEMAKDKGGLSVSVTPVVDDIGRRHYEVTVRNKYSFLLGDLLNIVGQKEVQTVEATVYVESYDVLNYINTVKFTKYGIDKITDEVGALKLIDTAIGILSNLFGG